MRRVEDNMKHMEDSMKRMEEELKYLREVHKISVETKNQQQIVMGGGAIPAATTPAHPKAGAGAMGALNLSSFLDATAIKSIVNEMGSNTSTMFMGVVITSYLSGFLLPSTLVPLANVILVSALSAINNSLKREIQHPIQPSVQQDVQPQVPTPSSAQVSVNIQVQQPPPSPLRDQPHS